MTDPSEFAELLDVDVDELARMGALIASHRLGGLESRKPVEAKAAQDAADSRRRHADLGCDVLSRVALPPQSLNRRGCGGRRLAWR